MEKTERELAETATKAEVGSYDYAMLESAKYAIYLKSCGKRYPQDEKYKNEPPIVVYNEYFNISAKWDMDVYSVETNQCNGSSQRIESLGEMKVPGERKYIAVAAVAATTALWLYSLYCMYDYKLYYDPLFTWINILFVGHVSISKRHIKLF